MKSGENSNKHSRRDVLAKIAGLGASLVVLPSTAGARESELRDDTISHGADQAESLEREYVLDVRIGETIIKLNVFENGPGFTYINVHANETTAAQVGRAAVKDFGGRYVELQNSKHRNIQFVLDGKKYEFDPNRIFSSAGIETTLKDKKNKNTCNYSPEASQAVEIFADVVLELVESTPVVIALHNNQEWLYSIKSYKKGIRGAVDVHVNTDKSPGDFVLVTEPSLFTSIVECGTNCVLEKAAEDADDGSLSQWCAGNSDKTYVNVEAKIGHFKEQVAMLHNIIRALQARKVDSES